MATARKKKVNNRAGYIIKPVAVKDVIKQADFGTFTLTIAKDCACYTNTKGYSVVTSPYTTEPGGKATDWSLYLWIKNIVENKDYWDAHINEPFPDVEHLTFRDYDDFVDDKGRTHICDYRQYLKTIEEYKANNGGLPKPDGKYWSSYRTKDNKYIYKDENGTWWPKSTIYTYDNLVQYMRIVTESNLIRPSAVFIDEEYANKDAVEYMDWMRKMNKLYEEAMNTTPPEEDEKANAEAFGEAIDTENFLNVIRQEED